MNKSQELIAACREVIEKSRAAEAAQRARQAQLQQTRTQPPRFYKARENEPQLDEATAKQPGLDGRHRDADGTTSRKRGDTLVSTLRKIYGKNFAPGFRDDQDLADVLDKLDEPSLAQLLKHLKATK